MFLCNRHKCSVLKGEVFDKEKKILVYSQECVEVVRFRKKLEF